MWGPLLRTLCGVLVLVSALEHSSYSAAPEAETFPANSEAMALSSQVEPAALNWPDDYGERVVYRVYRVTAYCDRGVTAAGVPSGLGQCAAPAGIPFGSRIYIPALGRSFVVTDRTARRFRHNTVDLFIPNKSECKRFGRRYLECEIAAPVEAARYGSARLHAAALQAASS
jgi:3D (Asp-Asp-Asp) domain-containing protein